MKYKHRTLMDWFRTSIPKDISPELEASLKRAFFKGAFAVMDMLLDGLEHKITPLEVNEALTRYTNELKGFSAALELGEV